MRRTILAGALVLTGCLPNGAPTGVEESARDAKAAKPATRPRPTMPPGLALAAMDPLLTQPFRDAFERAGIGPDWRITGATGWKIEEGKLCGRGAHNRGIWLTKRLPTNARIEFDAVALSRDGDIKVEAWGDGATGATQASYVDATSYLAILGGWKNSLHVLARRDEHGRDRLALEVDAHADDPRQRPVAPGQVYHVRVERRDGRTVTFAVDDTVIHAMVDPAPLDGAGHDHVGFNEWEAPVCFDDVLVTPL